MWYVKRDDKGNITEKTRSLYPIDGEELSDSELNAEEGAKFTTITIPLAVLMHSEELKDKLAEMALIFSDIKRRPDGQGNLVLSNINLEDVPKFLTAEEYTNLTKVGVLFDEKITALFASDEDDSDE